MNEQKTYLVLEIGTGLVAPYVLGLRLLAGRLIRAAKRFKTWACIGQH